MILMLKVGALVACSKRLYTAYCTWRWLKHYHCRTSAPSWTGVLFCMHNPLGSWTGTSGRMVISFFPLLARIPRLWLGLDVWFWRCPWFQPLNILGMGFSVSNKMFECEDFLNRENSGPITVEVLEHFSCTFLIFMSAMPWFPAVWFKVQVIMHNSPSGIGSYLTCKCCQIISNFDFEVPIPYLDFPSL